MPASIPQVYSRRRAGRPEADAPARDRTVLRFWTPLAVSWVLMMVTGPLINAVVARMPEAKEQLAALGIASSVVTVVQSPIIALLTASVTLARDPASLRKLTRFAMALLAAVTLAMLAVGVTPLYDVVIRGWIGAPDVIADEARPALLAMTLFPAAVGYRRLCQGIMIQCGLTREVTAASIIRLATVAGVIVGAWLWGGIGGATAGGIATGAGILMDALVTHWLSRPAVDRIRERKAEPDGAPLTSGALLRFYWPLAITSAVWLWSPTLINVGLTRSPYPVESLAVWPVVNSQVFLASSLGFSFMEAVIALLRDTDCAPSLRRFSVRLAVISTVLIGLIAFSPLARWWQQDVAGLDGELTAFAIPALRLSALIPAAAALLSWWRGLIVRQGETGPVAQATFVSIGALVVGVWVGVRTQLLPGAAMAAVALTLARLAEAGWLWWKARPLERRALEAVPVELGPDEPGGRSR